MTVGIERLLLKLCLGQGKDETSMKAFESCLTICSRDLDHVCEKIDWREQRNEV